MTFCLILMNFALLVSTFAIHNYDLRLDFCLFFIAYMSFHTLMRLVQVKPQFGR